MIIFTTNDLARLSKRFRDRCEMLAFSGESDHLQPYIQRLARYVWEREGMEGEPPGIHSLGMPTLGCPDDMHASFRLALKQLQKHIRTYSIPLVPTRKGALQ